MRDVSVVNKSLRAFVCMFNLLAGEDSSTMGFILSPQLKETLSALLNMNTVFIL